MKECQYEHEDLQPIYQHDYDRHLIVRWVMCMWCDYEDKQTFPLAFVGSEYEYTKAKGNVNAKNPRRRRGAGY